MTVEARVEIDASIDEVFGWFADLKRWPSVLSDTKAVDVLYFDGYNEEFTMTVSRPGGDETVRGVRYHRAARELELFQMTPPPGVRAMSGIWYFDSLAGNRTAVRATRNVELVDPDPASVAAFRTRLAGFLESNLLAFKGAIERDSRV